MNPNVAEGMANSVDPDQTAPLGAVWSETGAVWSETAPLGAVWSGSTLFAQACMSENLGSLWYTRLSFIEHVCELMVKTARKMTLFYHIF